MPQMCLGVASGKPAGLTLRLTVDMFSSIHCPVPLVTQLPSYMQTSRAGDTPSGAVTEHNLGVAIARLSVLSVCTAYNGPERPIKASPCSALPSLPIPLLDLLLSPSPSLKLTIYPTLYSQETKEPSPVPIFARLLYIEAVCQGIHTLLRLSHQLVFIASQHSNSKATVPLSDCQL